MEIPNQDARLEIWNQVDQGFKRRNKPLLQTAFDSHKDSSTELIAVSSLESALTNSGINFHERETAEMLTSKNLKDDGKLDLQDFFALVRPPSSPIEMWIGALNLNELIADAMPKSDGPRKDLLHRFSSTTQQQLEISCDVIKEYLVKILQENIVALQDMYAKFASTKSEDSDGSEKFKICKMIVGDINDFHGGLAARIGILCH
jgi:hypothetical protein